MIPSLASNSGKVGKFVTFGVAKERPKLNKVNSYKHPYEKRRSRSIFQLGQG